MKRIATGIFMGAMVVMVAVADDEQPAAPAVDSHQIVTTQNYVDTQLGTKQRKIGSGPNALQNPTEDGGSGANGDVVTYTGTAGMVGAKKIYSESAAYSTQTDRLVEAETVNNGIKKGLSEHLSCVQNNKNPTNNECWLYQMNTPTGVYLNQSSN